MGCHTWYRKPLVKGKENVQKYLREKIDIMRKEDYWNVICCGGKISTVSS